MQFNSIKKFHGRCTFKIVNIFNYRHMKNLYTFLTTNLQKSNPPNSRIVFQRQLKILDTEQLMVVNISVRFDGLIQICFRVIGYTSQTYIEQKFLNRLSETIRIYDT